MTGSNDGRDTTDRSGQLRPRSDGRLAACGRRTVLSAMAGGVALTAVHPAGARGSETTFQGHDERRSTPVPELQSGKPPATLEGTVTTAPVGLEERVLVGTTRGLYVLSDGALETFVPTRPVCAITPVTDDRVAVLVWDAFFPNVLLIDLEDGDPVWAASRSQQVYNHERGEERRQVPAFDAASLPAPTGGETPAIVVATGYGLAAYDGETGDVRWELDRDGHSWRVTVVDGTVYASTQDGKLLAIDGESGELEYDVELAEPYDGIYRSVWDVVPVDDGDRLAVTTEDGYLKLLEAADGSVVWERRILEFDGDDLDAYYRGTDGLPTMPGGPDRDPDRNFFNLEVTVVDDERFVVRTRDPERGPPGEQPGEVVLVGPGGDVEWRNDAVDVDRTERVGYFPNVDPNAVFVPEPPEHDEQAVTKIDLESGDESDVLELPAVPGPGRRGRPTGVGYVTDVDGDLVVASEEGDLLVVDASGEVHWSFPAVGHGEVLRGDFLGDGVDDYAIYSRNRLADRNRHARSLVVRSGADGSVAWSRSTDVDRLTDETSFREIRMLDGNGPGVDLLAIEQTPQTSEGRDQVRDLEGEIRELHREIGEIERDPGGNESEIEELDARIDARWTEIDELGGIPSLVVRSGETGDVEQRVNLRFSQDGSVDHVLEPVSVDVLSIDGEDTLAFVGGRRTVAIVDLVVGEVIWWLTYDDDGTLWPPVDADGDVVYRTIESPDAVDDIVAVPTDGPSFALVETDLEGEDILFDGTDPVDLPGERVIPDSIESIGDVNDDGHAELRCLTEDDDGVSTAVVLEPGERAVSTEVSGDELRPTVRTVPAPSGDGTGLVAVGDRGDTFTVTVHDGLEERYQREQELSDHLGRTPGEEYRPATLAGDIDGDGTEELAIATVAPEENGAKVDFYDIDSGDRVDSVVLESFEETDPDDDALVPAIRVDRIPDRNGSDAPALGIVADPGLTGDPTFYVVDPAEGKLVASGGSGNATFVTPEDEAVGVLGRDASLFSFDPTEGVTLDDPGDGSDLDLSWTFDGERDHVTTVSVNERPVTVTTEQSASLRLPDGNHDIAVAATNPDGVTTYDSGTVSVDDGSVMDLVLYATAGLSVAGLFAIGTADEIRRRVRS